MTAVALVSGRIVRDPERKASAKGVGYATATIRDGSGPDGAFWRLTVFSETAIDELMSLRAGDSLAASGPMSAQVYSPRGGGEPRVGLSLVADRIITATRPKRERAAPADRRTSSARTDLRSSVHAPAGFAGPIDGIPF